MTKSRAPSLDSPDGTLRSPETGCAAHHLSSCSFKRRVGLKGFIWLCESAGRRPSNSELGLQRKGDFCLIDWGSRVVGALDYLLKNYVELVMNSASINYRI